MTAGVHWTPEKRAAIRRRLANKELPKAIAAAEGVRIDSVRRVRWEMVEEAAKLSPGPTEKAVDGRSPSEGRKEVRDATFWRGKARVMEVELSRAEHIAAVLAGLRATPFSIPDWILDTRSRAHGSSVIGSLVSDVHMGEKIASEEILGINAFDPDICRARMETYFNQTCTLGPIWSQGTELRGILLALAGDLISGNLHWELSVTNEGTSHEQLAAVVALLEAGLRLLLEVYPHVHVVGVPGNHGRTTIKPTAKLNAKLSYDILAISMLAERFRDNPRVTWQFGQSTDQITPVFGRTILTTHGDKIGTRGGAGFAGPDLPIVRGAKKIREQQAAVGWNHDLVQFGHYHWSTNPANGRVLGNGSVPGYSEYASDLRAVVEPPQQWLYRLHSKWWMQERMPIQLADPTPPKMPRVRVPANFERVS
jgi:hypothetical protein